MRKFVLISASIGSLIILNSCEEQPKFNLKKVGQEINSKVVELQPEEKKRLVGILNAVFPNKWKILGIFKVSESEEPFLKKYLVKVYSPYEHIIWNKFVWFSKDGKLLIPTTYFVSKESVNLIVPKKEKEFPLESLRWILDVERIALEGNIPITLTNGKRIVYIIWNPYCKICFKQWNKILKLAREKNVSLNIS